MALLFSVARRTAESGRHTRAGRFGGCGPILLLGRHVSGKTLGVAGAGKIGTAMARKSLCFRMRIFCNDVVENEQLGKELGAKKVDLQVLLKEGDFISIHVPLGPQTTHLIGEKGISLMKPTAYLINTSRGPVVDEKALALALKEKRIAGGRSGCLRERARA